DGSNDITFGELSDLKVIRYAKGEFENSNQIKNAANSVAVSGKTLDSDTYTVDLDRETYTFCVQYNDESYNYYVTGVCGDNLTWVYDKQSDTLTVSGEGEMYNYSEKTLPWIQYKSEIKTGIVNNKVTNLGKAAFVCCTLLESVSLPSTLEKIGEEAFYDCDSLETIIIPDNVTNIEDFAFCECDNLKTIIIPDNVAYIEEFAFGECDNLESVVTGEGISTIEMFAFARCPNLKKVVFGNNIKIIGDQAFVHCTSLNNIDLPDSVEEIGDYVFYGTGFYNNEENWENGVLYSGKCLIKAEVSGTYIIKDGTKTIGYAAFEDSYISVCYIPESVEHIPFGGLGNENGKYSHFKVVEGSYAEQHIIEIKKNYPHVGLTYSYFNPSDVYG
ncbi:MAG: leucine-rich repeat domain-containing protein, partial [Clostridia bacterium]|nr:leucine-rich repeat domain-containing protein [Clostridia bacterium]